jgi:hypothetical protein
MLRIGFAVAFVCCRALAFLIVIPEGNLLLVFYSLALISWTLFSIPYPPAPIPALSAVP